MESAMPGKKQKRQGKRKETLAILDILEWVLRRLREIAEGD
jgi:hypothetical protein